MAIVEADASLTLSQLNVFVAQNEAHLQGPLKAIGNGDGKTKLTIDDEDPNGAPAKAAIITTGAVPPGAQPISAGQIFIEGVLTNAAAYRPA